MVDPLDATDMDMIRRGDMLGPRLGARTAAYIEDLKRDLYLTRNECANARDHILAAKLKEREACAIEADEIGKAYGEDETGWLDCSETIAKAIRSRP